MERAYQSSMCALTFSVSPTFSRLPTVMCSSHRRRQRASPTTHAHAYADARMNSSSEYIGVATQQRHFYLPHLMSSIACRCLILASHLDRRRLLPTARKFVCTTTASSSHAHVPTQHAASSSPGQGVRKAPQYNRPSFSCASGIVW